MQAAEEVAAAAAAAAAAPLPLPGVPQTEPHDLFRHRKSFARLHSREPDAAHQDDLMRRTELITSRVAQLALLQRQLHSAPSAAASQAAAAAPKAAAAAATSRSV